MKLRIDDPCHENWDAMTPNEQGAFCLSCQKTVVDFSTKTLHEIKFFFTELPLTEKVCGRFENRQLEELSFDHFFKRFRRWHLLHKIAVVCFFVFGTSLFSCSPGGHGKEMILGAVMPPDTLHEQVITADTSKALPEKLPEVMKMGEVMAPQDTVKKKPVKKIPVAPEDPRLMIQGDISIEPEVIKCPPKDTTAKSIKMGKVSAPR